MSRRILAALAIIAGGICLGYWLQRDVPSESNRIRHPQAYSLIRPQDWSAEVTFSDGREKIYGTPLADSLELTPDHFDGIPPKLFANRLVGTPEVAAMEADGWTNGVFQGQPAFVREKKFPKSLSRGAIFERSGKWFEVVEGLSVPASVQKDQWWQFLETFRYPDGQVPTATPAGVWATSAPAASQPFDFPSFGK